MLPVALGVVLLGVVSFEIGPVLASVLTSLLNVVAMLITHRIRKDASTAKSVLARGRGKRLAAKRRRGG